MDKLCQSYLTKKDPMLPRYLLHKNDLFVLLTTLGSLQCSREGTGSNKSLWGDVADSGSTTATKKTKGFSAAFKQCFAPSVQTPQKEDTGATLPYFEQLKITEADFAAFKSKYMVAMRIIPKMGGGGGCHPTKVVATRAIVRLCKHPHSRHYRVYVDDVSGTEFIIAMPNGHGFVPLTSIRGKYRFVRPRS
jgi:hypothetical protein